MSARQLGFAGQVRAVGRKELTDALRDRRSLMSALLYPLLMPLMIAVMFSALARTLSSDRPLETSALQMFVATFARTFKEAQTYVSLLIFVPIIPSTVLQFYALQSAGWMMLIPALSHHLLLVDVMGGEQIAALRLATSAAATTLLAILFLSLSSWMLRQEKIVFGRA